MCKLRDKCEEEKGSEMRKTVIWSIAGLCWPLLHHERQTAIANCAQLSNGPHPNPQNLWIGYLTQQKWFYKYD